MWSLLFPEREKLVMSEMCQIYLLDLLLVTKWSQKKVVGTHWTKQCLVSKSWRQEFWHGQLHQNLRDSIAKPHPSNTGKNNAQSSAVNQKWIQGQLFMSEFCLLSDNSHVSAKVWFWWFPLFHQCPTAESRTLQTELSQSLKDKDKEVVPQLNWHNLCKKFEINKLTEN